MTVTAELSRTDLISLHRSVVWLPAAEARRGLVARWLPDSGRSVCDIDMFATRVLELIDGTKQLDGIASALNVDTESVEAELIRLNEHIPGIFEWQPADSTENTRHQNQLALAKQMQRTWEAANWLETANSEFHSAGIDDAHRQFDDVETTVSHMFREPHPALNGRRYGEAFCDWLIENDRIPAAANIIEIGCGVGYFTNALLNRLRQVSPNVYDTITYTMFDLSPELQSSQRQRCAAHSECVRFQSGNIEDFDFDGRQFDLVISNEVIADLSVSSVNVARVRNKTPQTSAEQLACNYNLACSSPFDGSPSEVAINSGAIRLIEKMKGLLAAGGSAVLTEYGHLDRMPEAISFGDHYEFTINFGHLQQVAEALNLNPALHGLGDMLLFDPAFPILDLRSQNSLLKALLPELGHETPPTMAYSLEMLTGVHPEVSSVRNLETRPLKEVQSITPYQFFALVLKQPKSSV